MSWQYSDDRPIRDAKLIDRANYDPDKERHPHKSKRKKHKSKPYRPWHSVCPFCDADLPIVKKSRWRWTHKYAQECSCGAYRVHDCPCCHHETWYKEGIYKHQSGLFACGFTGRRKKI